MKHLIYILPIIVGSVISCNPNSVEGNKAHDHEIIEHEEHNSDEITLSPEKAKNFGVLTSIITPSDFNETVVVSGQIIPAKDNEHTIAATKPGIVRFVKNIHLGYHVTKGEQIVAVSGNDILGGDQDKSAKITFENAKREFERISALYENQLVTESEYIAAKEAFQQAQNIYKPKAEMHASSISGTISEIYVNDGDYVETGMPIATVSSNNVLILQADLPERYAKMNIHTANFKPAYSDSVYSISSLGGESITPIKSATTIAGYIPICFSFNNSDGLMANSYAEVYLIGATRHNVLSLPVSALTEEQGDYFVYEKIDEECYAKHLVKTGMSNGINIEILSGIDPGMEIVTKGAVIVKLAANSGAVPGHSHEH